MNNEIRNGISGCKDSLCEIRTALDAVHNKIGDGKTAVVESSPTDKEAYRLLYKMDCYVLGALNCINGVIENLEQALEV